ncbi:TlpA disulfide reductase family protein [Nannocystis punicea]|uniref:TlpA disulfide reductase family protein n=1 Tax=Nannocystis punicea TaxID=2995304 RepID=A0ABY7H6U9_9BACT|nr:TlpA disulfide reductase family protein [Nannocystis poenicansa]WAS94820.1 TlpA disulfide reductase family protein [Nannocystis poenicansa]
MRSRPVLFAMFLLSACEPQPATKAPDGGAPATAEAPAPALSGPSLAGAGASVDLAAMRGKLVLVDFWASWCEPCRRELPELEALYKKHQASGLELIGVSMDEQRADAEAFLRDVTVSFPMIHDEGQALAKSWSPPKMPTLYVIDREGKVAKVIAGEVKIAELEAEVTQRLGG